LVINIVPFYNGQNEISDLIDRVAAPDLTDTADLRLFARDLKTSLAQVETTLARLDKASD